MDEGGRGRRLLSTLHLVLLALALAAGAVKIASCLPDAGFGHARFYNGVLGPAAKLLAAAATFAGALCRRRFRATWIWFALATALWGVGDLYGQIALSADSTAADAPAFSFSDAVLLAAYPCWYVGLVLGNQASMRHTSSRRWLDGAIVSCSVLAVSLAWALPTVLDGLRGTSPVQAGLAVAYPLADLAVVGFVVVILVSQGRQQSAAHSVLGLALLIICGTDLSYALAVAHDTYSDGDLHDAGWVLGLALIAVAAASTARRSPDRSQASELPRLGTTALPILGTAVALSLLCLATVRHLSPIAVAFAAGAIVFSCLRMAWSLQEASSASVARREARTDALTGLANRRYVQERVGQLGESGAVALLLMDLDGFKEINDVLGHTVGDRVLVDVGDRLRTGLDSAAELARLGGDEFVLVLAGPVVTGLRERAEAAARSIVDLLAEPFVAQDRTVAVSASIGIALGSAGSFAFDELLRRADVAMYRAKRARTGTEIYDDQPEGPDRLAQLADIRRGLDASEFVLHYQPQLQLRSGRVDGVEALVRWQHPGRGMLAPAAFLDLITTAGLLPRLTQTVLDQAAAQSASWRGAGIAATISVNLPPSALADPAIVTQLHAALGRYGLPAASLVLELTEDALVGDDENTLDTVRSLRRHGFALSIDDFGTGYSSLAYLIGLPIDEVKIDRSLILELADNERAAAVLGSIIDLAHNLELVVVAEGIEDGETLEVLVELGCDVAQGYHIARPAPAAEIAHLLSPRGRDLVAESSRAQAVLDRA